MCLGKTLTIDKYKTVTVSDWVVHCVISTGKVVSVRPLYTIEGESYIRTTTHTTAFERHVSVLVIILGFGWSHECGYSKNTCCKFICINTFMNGLRSPIFIRYRRVDCPYQGTTLTYIRPTCYFLRAGRYKL